MYRRISCPGRNYSQPYFFKRNQSSDNRSHGFGAKFLLKKLSASDFSYERKSALWRVKGVEFWMWMSNGGLEQKAMRVSLTKKRTGRERGDEF